MPPDPPPPSDRSSAPPPALPADLPVVHDTVVHMLADAARRAPAAVALSCAGTDLTYDGYLGCVAGLAGDLAAAGAGRGERVALVMGNSIDMAIAMFAAHAAGAQVVPVNPVYTTREIAYILADAAPAAVIHDADAGDRVRPIADDLGIGSRIASGGADFLRWRDAGRPLPAPLPAPGDLATLQYTGGTTGRPKGVDITHRQMSVNVSQREAILPTAADDETVICVMPLFHVFAVSMCLHLAVYCRGRLVILPRYHPAELLAAMARERVTILPAGPTIYTGLLNFAGFAAADLSALRWCYSGSAPLPEETLRRWEAATGCFILEGYGQTEAGPVLTYNPAAGTRKPGSVGVPLAATEVEIVDVETGTRVLPAGEPGEIRARGPQVMAGYRNLPDETAATLRGGWLHTGDIGAFDADGYLFIRDRKKDMAIVGGYNVYPREIDEVLYGHPAVAEAAAVGVPDAYYGEVIKAWVVLREGAAATADDLAAHCAANLAKYKLPREIVIAAAIPRTTVGKIDKKALRA